MYDSEIIILLTQYLSIVWIDGLHSSWPLTTNLGSKRGHLLEASEVPAVPGPRFGKAGDFPGREHALAHGDG